MELWVVTTLDRFERRTLAFYCFYIAVLSRAFDLEGLSARKIRDPHCVHVHARACVYVCVCVCSSCNAHENNEFRARRRRRSLRRWQNFFFSFFYYYSPLFVFSSLRHRHRRRHLRPEAYARRLKNTNAFIKKTNVCGDNANSVRFFRVPRFVP